MRSLLIATAALAWSPAAAAQSTDILMQQRAADQQLGRTTRTFQEVEARAAAPRTPPVADPQPQLAAIGRCILDAAPADAAQFAEQDRSPAVVARLKPVFDRCGKDGLPSGRIERMQARRVAVRIAMGPPAR